MNSDLQILRDFLDQRDVEGFIRAYAAGGFANIQSPEKTGITQRLLPPLLLEALERNQLTDDTFGLLVQLLRTWSLLVVDEAVTAAVERRLGDVAVPAAARAAPRARWLTPPRLQRPEAEQPRTVQMQRVRISTEFTLGWAYRGGIGVGVKNICASQQEREFLRAVRQFFPSCRAYPNYPLRGFIDTGQPMLGLEERERSYSWAAMVDVLLCTEDDDPIAGFELDSEHHDTDEARERDALKNRLFEAAGLPLLRIRPTDTRTVRAEDFYALLNRQQSTLDELVRARHLVPHGTHDFMVPVGVA